MVIATLLLILFMQQPFGLSGKLEMTFVSTMLSGLVCWQSGEKLLPLFPCGKFCALTYQGLAGESGEKIGTIGSRSTAADVASPWLALTRCSGSLCGPGADGS